MGNWSEQQEVRKEVKEKDKVRREKLASLFFDLCKVTYTVLVVGLLVTLFQNELYTNYLMIALVVVGVLVAFKEIIIMVALIGLIIIAIPVTAFWIYTETPSGKKWIKNL